MNLLNNQTLTKVKNLCKSDCCNFINSKCILTGKSCDYFTHHGKSISCDWFEENVLLNDKATQEAYQNQHGLTYIDTDEIPTGKYLRTCKCCNIRFKTDSRNVLTCSEQCRKELRKATNKSHYLRQSKPPKP